MLLPAVQVEPSYSSELAESPGFLPPRPTAAVCVPTPAIFLLAVFKSPLSVQLVPLYSSVSPIPFAGSPGDLPPICKPAV